jgi:cytochrome c oxidase subunit IV
MEGRWFFPLADQNGVFLICFAFGWFLITVLTALFTCTQWWALIPGGIMALIGGGILVTNGTVRWEDLNLVYAVILISIGLVLLAYKGRAKKNE